MLKSETRKNQIYKKKTTKKPEPTWVNSSSQRLEIWDRDNPHIKKTRKNHKAQSLTNSMLNDKIKKIINFFKKNLKNISQLELIFKIRDLDYGAETNLIKQKPRKITKLSSQSIKCWLIRLKKRIQPKI
jgi:hypothetical protein